MSINILFITDLHVKISTFEQLDHLQKYLQEWIKKAPRLDCIVVGGDTLDTHEKLCSLSLSKACNFIDFLTQLSPCVYILVGNHDYINNSQLCTDKHWLNVLKKWGRVIVVDKPKKSYIKNKGILFVPYVPPGSFNTILESVDSEDANIIFAHQEFRGCKMGSIESVIGDEWTRDICVISGHIHEMQNVGNVYYPGSSISHSCSHKSEGPCLVTIDSTLDINHIGFTAQRKSKQLNANSFDVTTLQQDTKYIIKGTSVSIAETLGNPLLRKMLSDRKIVQETKNVTAQDWERYLVENVTSSAMLDDLNRILSKY
uniref:Calcineurin-like phosphoesterase domain-containing protein n=1 Tax=Erythrocytic necrosis virus TaxID=1543320 RepID=A0A4D6QIA6_9VIRU|nr:hypothetical protein [Erythrocytic necrosis virus]